MRFESGEESITQSEIVNTSVQTYSKFLHRLFVIKICHVAKTRLGLPSTVTSPLVTLDTDLYSFFLHRAAHNLLEDFAGMFLDGKSSYLEATDDSTFSPFGVRN